jgi:DNA polymerase III delta subunit
MTPEDRKKITDAFNEAVRTSPFADERIEGLYTNEGEPMTRRKLIEGSLKSEEFFEQLDIALQKGRLTLDQYISQVSEAMKKSYYGDAPKP